MPEETEQEFRAMVDCLHLSPTPRTYVFANRSEGCFRTCSGDANCSQTICSIRELDSHYPSSTGWFLISPLATHACLKETEPPSTADWVFLGSLLFLSVGSLVSLVCELWLLTREHAVSPKFETNKIAQWLSFAVVLLPRIAILATTCQKFNFLPNLHWTAFLCVEFVQSLYQPIVISTAFTKLTEQ